MAIESTAINDLIAGFQQRPLQRDSSDWLFGERDDATEIDSGNDEKATTPFDRTTPPVVPLPQPFVQQSAFVHQPAPALDALYRSPSPTTYVRPVSVSGIAKKLALPIGVLSIVVVVLGVYFAKTDSSKPAAAAKIDPPAQVAKLAAPPPAPVAAPSVAPVAQPKQEAKADEPASSHEPAEAKTIEVAPLVVEAKPDVKAEAPATDSKPAAEAKPTAEAKPAEAKPTEEPKPVEPQVVIEPGSPASRFLGTAPTQPTVPTVSKKLKPAPAPTAVADLPPPPAKVAETKPAESVAAKSVAAKPVAKSIAAKPAPVAKKTAAQVRAEKRAAAKRAAQASIAAAKARSTKKVAAAEDEEADDADEEPAKKPEPKPVAKPGKGVLQIASTPAMEVWVDGRNSGAQTPVRIILLSGKHKVTLFDKQNAKTKTFEIEIRPDETTKVTKNYD